MKLKGSVTIEAAVIIPLFTIMVVNIILLGMDCHDRTIINCASDKMCMEVEFDSRKSEDYNSKILKLEEKGKAYLSGMTLRTSGELEISTGLLDVTSKYSQILKNNPVDFVWITDAAEKLVKKGK